MEFDIGNLLYVIITIVAIAIGLLTKKRKPEQQGTGESGSERKPGFFENLEKMLNQEQYAGDPVETYTETFQDEDSVMEDETAEPAIEEKPAHRSILDDYNRLMNSQPEMTGNAESISEITPGEEAALEVIHLDEDDGTDYFEVVEEFNAATAVVYSAIINRIDY